MKKIIFAITTLLSLVSSNILCAQDFFDKSDARNFFNVGARLGFNTSNRTFPKGNYSNYTYTAWGLGFDAGVIANLNFKDYLTIQPGFFFESRSSQLVNFVEYIPVDQQYGSNFSNTHQRSYFFTIPIMGIVNFNLSEKIRWSVEFGPYFQLRLKETGAQKHLILLYGNRLSDFSTVKSNNFDFGFKMGTGLEVMRHYYVGIHYLAGVCHAWSIPSGGKNKSWMFTLGYNF